MDLKDEQCIVEEPASQTYHNQFPEWVVKDVTEEVQPPQIKNVKNQGWWSPLKMPATAILRFPKRESREVSAPGRAKVRQPNGKALYFPELDGLRFLAFLMVFIHHAPQLATFGFLQAFQGFLFTLHIYGWMGVDLFLCLSAFLFTKLLLVEQNTHGDINIKNFYIRRLLRIWPLYYIFITVMLLITSSPEGWNRALAFRSLGPATFTDNILTAALGYNMIFASAHLWTISYEEQFYAVIPWFLRRLFKMSNTGRFQVIFAILILFTSIRAFMIYKNVQTPAIWVLPVTHFESIFGGIILGLGWFDKLGGKINPKACLIAGIILLIMVCKLPNADTISWYLMLTYPLVGLGMSLIIYAIMKDDRSFIKNIFRSRMMTYLGKISYGLYVYHLLAINCGIWLAKYLNILPDRIITFQLAVFTSGLWFTVLFSIVSYQLLEKPFLRYKERFTAIKSRPV
jgi:peptidoglycan/LPS O-acetylase OafA/YrhL